MNHVSYCCLGLLVSACSSSSPGGGSVNGTVTGMTIHIADAISAKRPTSSLASGGDGFILMTSTGDACADVDGGIARRGSSSVIISLSDVGSAGATAPTGSGTYKYYGSAPPTAPYKSLNDLEINMETDVGTTCGFAALATITSGTVTVSSVTGDVFSGTFDVSLDSGDHVTGAFHPDACPGLVDPPNPTTCN